MKREKKVRLGKTAQKLLDKLAENGGAMWVEKGHVRPHRGFRVSNYGHREYGAAEELIQAGLVREVKRESQYVSSTYGNGHTYGLRIELIESEE